MARSRLPLLGALALGLVAPAAAQDSTPRPAVVAWVRRTAALWARADVETRSLLALRLWTERARSDEVAAAARLLTARAAAGSPRELLDALGRRPVEPDPFAPPATEPELAALLAASDDGDPLDQAGRYLTFLRRLDAGGADLASTLRRLKPSVARHPWVRAQRPVLAARARWRELQGRLPALPLPDLQQLQRVRLWLVEGGEPRSLGGWLLRRDGEAFVALGDDLARRELRWGSAGEDPRPGAASRGALPRYEPEPFERAALARLAAGPRREPLPGAPSLALSYPSETLLLATIAERLGRPGLAVRLHGLAEASQRAADAETALRDAFTGETADRLWRAAAELLLARRRAEALPLVEALAAEPGFAGTTEQERCVELLPGVRRALEPAPPAGEGLEARLALLSYRLQEQPGEQLSFPGGPSFVGTGPAEELVRIGWPAVPALIALLDDPRPTCVAGRWRPGSPPYVYTVGEVASRILTAILGAPLREVVAPGGFAGSRAELRPSAEAWWGRVGPAGPVAFGLARLDEALARRAREGRGEFPWRLIESLTRSETVREASPELLERARAASGPEEQARWLSALARSPLLVSDARLKDALDSGEPSIVRAAAWALIARGDETAALARAGLERQIDVELTVSRGPRADFLRSALELLTRRPTPALLALADRISQATADVDREVLAAVRALPDEALARVVLARLARRPRRATTGSTTSFGDGRSYSAFTEQDEAALLLAERLGEDPRALFPLPACEAPRERDAQIEALLARAGL